MTFQTSQYLTPELGARWPVTPTGRGGVLLDGRSRAATDARDRAMLSPNARKEILWIFSYWAGGIHAAGAQALRCRRAVRLAGLGRARNAFCSDATRYDPWRNTAFAPRHPASIRSSS